MKACDFTRPTWNGPRSGRRRPSTSPAATSWPVRSTISRARARRCRSPGTTTTATRRSSTRSPRATASTPPQSRRRAARRARTSRSTPRCSSPTTICWSSGRATIRCSAAAGSLGANVVRFERRFEDGYALDPDRVARAITPRTRLIVITAPHNPTGALADRAALEAVGRHAQRGRRTRARRRGLPRRGRSRTPPGGDAWRHVHHHQQSDEVVRPLQPALRLDASPHPPWPNASAARATSSTAPARSSRSGWRRSPSRSCPGSRARAQALLVENGALDPRLLSRAAPTSTPSCPRRAP